MRADLPHFINPNRLRATQHVPKDLARIAREAAKRRRDEVVLFSRGEK